MYAAVQEAFTKKVAANDKVRGDVVDDKRFELSTSAMRTQRSPN